MKRSIDMTQGSLFYGILVYAIPVMLTTVLQLTFNAADMIVVGRYCGSICLAAVSAVGPLNGLIVNLFMGLSIGVSVAVAQAIGSRNQDTIHKTVHTAVPASILSGLFVAVIGLLFSRSLLKMLETPESVLPLSARYMQYYYLGVPFTMIYSFCASILRATGDTKGPLIYLAVSGIANVVLNLFFVCVFHMDVAGVALATAISQAISAVLVIIALIKRTDACRLNFKKMHFYGPELKKIIRIGLPAGMQNTLFSISNTMIQSSINSFGPTVMSANGAGQNIDTFASVANTGISQATVNYVGQNVGANNYPRVKKVYFISVFYGVLFSIILGGIIRIFGESLLSIYITDSSEAITYGLIRFNFIALPYFLGCLMDISTCSLRGMGVSFISMLISVFGICGIRIVWLLTIFQLPQYHTLECLYFSYPLTWAVVFFIQTIAFFIVYKKRQQSSIVAAKQSLI